MADDTEEDQLVVDKDGFVLCPRCSSNILIGNGGLNNFTKQHLGSKKCEKDRKKQEKDRTSQKKTRLLTSFFSKKSAATPVPSTVSAPPLIAVPRPPLGRVQYASPGASESNRIMPAGQQLLRQLQDAIKNIPASMPEAEDGDIITRFAGEPPTLPSEDAWEMLDPMLNRLVGYGVTAERAALDMRRGENGLDGLYRFLKHFVEINQVEVVLLEGKMGVLLKAIKIASGISCDASDNTRKPDNDDDDLVLLDGPPDDADLVLLNGPPDNADLVLVTGLANVAELVMLDGPPDNSGMKCQSDDESDIVLLDGPPGNATSERRLSTSNNSTRTYSADKVPVIKRPKQCQGYILTFPPGQTASSSYPFMLHDARSIPWEYELRADVFTLRARSCSGRAVTKDQCPACNKLEENGILAGIISRIAEGIHENAPFMYYGCAALADLTRRKNATIDELRLRRLNDARKLVVHAGVIDQHKQMLLAIASQKIPRIDKALHAGFKRHMGMHAMLELVKRAANGTYHPKSFDEEDDLQAVLLLRLGGGRIANIVHRIHGSPAASTVHRRPLMPLLLASPETPQIHEIQGNVVSCFESLKDLEVMRLGGIFHGVVMFDEIATERRPRWDDKSNKFLGICREHAAKTTLVFETKKDLEMVFEDLERGEVHLASEATVGAVGLLNFDSRLYSARPVLISGSCKRENAEQHGSIIQTTIDAVNGRADLTHTRIVSLASDGEARRGRALINLTFKHKLQPSSPIYNMLTPLALMDFHVGDDDITPDKDYKHVFKRLRNALLRKKGIRVCGIWLTPSVIQAHLRDAGHSAIHIRSVFDPEDKQDVVLAYNLLKDIWTLPPCEPSTKVQPGFIAARDALKTFGLFCYHLIYPYVCVDMSLTEQLEHLSVAAHLALALFAHDRAHADFVPSPLYIDIMLMVKNVYFCVAKAKADLPDSKFFIILLGTDRLEMLFGILRTMVGNDANLDILQLALRLAGTTDVANIFARYPEWDKGPRRLHLPTISRSDMTIPDAADHINPRSWRADVTVRGTSLASCWKTGRRLAEKLRPFCVEIFSQMDNVPHASILAPHGILLFSLSLSDSNLEEDMAIVDESNSSSFDESTIRATEGLQELEDSAVDAEWDTGAEQRSFSKAIDLDGRGTLVNKSKALAMLFKYKKTVSSTDRLRRVQQEGRYKLAMPQLIDGPGIDDSQGPVLLVHDPVATLVSVEKKYFLCIGEINGIWLDTKPVDELPLELLSEKTVSISYQALKVVPATSDDDPQLKHDWRSSYALPFTSKVPGFLIQPINLPLSTYIPTRPRLLFDSSTLMALASSIHDRLTRNHFQFIPHTKDSSDFPYREQSGKACFITERSDEVRDIIPDSCPRCSTTITFDSGQRVLEHIGSHILYDTAVDRELEPCGLCLRPFSLCQIFLQKARGRKGNVSVDQNKSTCQNLVKFSYGSASEPSATSPCSNVPMTCPLCAQTDPAVWRYNFQAHFRRAHPGVSIDHYEDRWILQNFEKRELQGIWRDRHKRRQKRSKKNKNTPLVISEAHSSRLTLGQTNNEDELTRDDESTIPDDSEDEYVDYEYGEAYDDGGHRQEAEDVAVVGVTNTGPSESEAVSAGGSTELQAEAATGEQDESTETDVDDTPIALPQLEPSTIKDTSAGMNDASAAGPSDTGPATIDLHPTRSGRKRKGRDIKEITLCICGQRASSEEGDSVECKKAGCETKWYHLECVDLEQAPRNWICETCSDSQKGKRRRN